LIASVNDACDARGEWRRNRISYETGRKTPSHVFWTSATQPSRPIERELLAASR
jgi:hypothetical protein